MENNAKHMMKNDGYLIPNNVYDVLKWVAIILLPALATFIETVGPAWGLSVDAVVLTISAFGTFLGTLIGVSHLMKAMNNNERA